MRIMRTALTYGAVLALCAGALPVNAQDALYERPVNAYGGEASSVPSGAAMAGDALVGRPLLAVATVLGAATFLVSLPFSLAGRNVGESADRLVGGPLRATVARCLGCVRPDQSTHSSQTRSYGEEYDTAY